MLSRQKTQGFFNFRESLLSKLVIAFILLITIPVFVIATIYKSSTVNVVERNAKEAMKGTMEQTNIRIELILSNLEEISMHIFSKENLQQYYAKLHYESTFESMKEKEKIENDFESIEFTNKFIDNICIFSFNSKDFSDDIGLSADNAVLNYLEGDERKEFIQSDIVNKIISANGRSMWFGHKNFGFSENFQENIYMGRLVKNLNNGKPMAIMFITLEKEIISDILNSIKLGEGGRAYFITEDNVVFSSQTDDIENSDDFFQYSFAEKALKIDEEDCENNYKNFNDEQNGNKLLVNVFSNNERGTHFVGILPSQSLIKSLKKTNYLIVIIGIIAIFVAAIIGVLLAFSITKQIRNISNVALKIEKGDLTLRIKNDKKDELGKLSNRLNTALDSISFLIKNVNIAADKVLKSSEVIAGTSEEVAASANEVSSAVKDITEGTLEQSNEAEKGAKMIKQLSNSIDDILYSTNNIETISRETQKLTDKGLYAMNELKNKSEETVSITKCVAENNKDLFDESKSIENILSVINGISEQTNLLALNAAIEAARAGENGKGFAVVANEVRKLSEQTKEAAGDINDIIKLIQQKSDVAVRETEKAEVIVNCQKDALDKAVNIFDTITKSMEKLIHMVKQVVSDVDNAEIENKNVNKSIRSILKVTNQSAAASEEVTASSEEQNSAMEQMAQLAQELRELSDDLVGEVGKFKI
jgi:methyl-accepting chemotaxis protein